jgi:hypothetical protein
MSGAPGGDITIHSESSVKLRSESDLFISAGYGGASETLNLYGSSRVNIFSLDNSCSIKTQDVTGGLEVGLISGMTPEAGLWTIEDTIFTALYKEDNFTNTYWQDLTGVADGDGGVAKAAAFEVTGYAPTTKDTDASGTGEAYGGGAPAINRLYRENVVKAKGVIRCVSIDIATTITTARAKDAFNIKVDVAAPNGTSYTRGELIIKFLTAMPDAEYSVTYGFDGLPSTGPVVGYISAKDANGFTLVIYSIPLGGGALVGPGSISVPEDLYVHFQVV